MTRFSLARLWLAVVVLLGVAACGGGASQPGPDPNFTRLSAVVTDANGHPLANLNVRVEGRDTGILTDSSGQFALGATAFPNGVNALNELAFGKNGIVLGTHDLVPSADQDVTIRFASDSGSGSASIEGTAYAGGGNWGGPIPMLATADGSPIAAQPLDGVQVTLFSADKNEVYQTTTSGGGHYSFSGLAGGTWQLAALLDGYYPEMAVVKVDDGAGATYDFSMTTKGVVPPGTGFKVSGTLKDSKTGAPIAGATVNLFADTGYTGIYYPVPPGATTPPTQDPPEANTGTTTMPPAGASNMNMPEDMPQPGKPDDPAGMPYRYDPQSQTTVTAADGSFSFPDDVIGYNLFLSYSAEGYLAGNSFQDISGRTTDLSLSLTMDPLVPASISGHVADASGQPVADAEVDFVFASGGWGGGVAVPGFANLDDIAADGKANYDSTGGSTGPMPGQAVPPTPPSYPGGQGGGDAAAPMPEANGSAGQAPADATSDPGSEFNNILMQRFLWEQKQKGGSAVAADFSGFVSARTDANGDYHIADVPAGHYYVMANAYKHIGYGGDAELAADPATNTLDITLPVVPVGSVEGTIVDAQGHPVPDALVNATQPFVDPFSFTDAQGHYRIDNVPTGEWTISAFKSGYITSTTQTTITENGVAQISLTLNPYTGPDQSTATFTGTLTNSADNTGVVGAALVFTPVKAELGGYFKSVTSGAGGAFSATLVPDTEYTLLIQKDGFDDLNLRVWTDSQYPELNFWLWPAGLNGGGGWGGTTPPPMPGTPGNSSPGDPGQPDQGPPTGI
jgi:protocatechuate 3,4-dioxygenase beta subunit